MSAATRFGRSDGRHRPARHRRTVAQLALVLWVEAENHWRRTEHDRMRADVLGGRWAALWPAAA